MKIRNSIYLNIYYSEFYLCFFNTSFGKLLIWFATFPEGLQLFSFQLLLKSRICLFEQFFYMTCLFILWQFSQRVARLLYILVIFRKNKSDHFHLFQAFCLKNYGHSFNCFLERPWRNTRIAI